ncbi:MAG: SDR family NAD(P)-dependent oxidoreductase [Pleomorphochaeta sp.]
MKNALVTGASHGIGQAIAIELAEKGYNVGINYFHNLKGAEETAKEVEKRGAKALIIQADVSKNADLEKMFTTFEKEFKSIDVMVNNAGISEFYPILEATEEQWKKVIFCDFKGCFFGTQLAARLMVKNNTKGVILNIGSNHTDGCWPNATIYASSKAAVKKFGENAAMELAEYGIRVTTLSPGYTNVDWPKDHPIFNSMEKIPLKRFASPKEVAKIAAFLCSEDCAYMTGNCVVVDGGSLLPILPENTYYGAESYENCQN